MNKMSFFGYSFIVLAILFSDLIQAYRHTPAEPPRANDYVDVKPQETLEVHNKARAMVGVGPMVWNETLATHAQERARDCTFRHSFGYFGENIAVRWGTMSGPVATEYWLTQKELYDYDSNTCAGDYILDCMSYNQIVWRDSVHLGCGSVRCKNEYIFVVCNYDTWVDTLGYRPY